MLSLPLVRALLKGQIKVIVYDLDGVMYCHSSGIEQGLLERICAVFSHLAGVDAAEARRLVWAAYNVHGTSYAHYPEYSVTPQVLAEAVYRDAPLDGLKPCEVLRQQLATFARWDMRLGIGSNSILVHPQRVLSALGVGDLFPDERIITLCQTGYVAKPHRSFFEVVLQRADAQPQEVLFVEDSLMNIPALKAMGFWTAQITSVGEHRREQSPFADACAPTIQEFHHELLGLFR